jgi:hypothetical protein
MRLRKPRPSDTSSVLKVPSVHVVEGVDVEILARNDADRRNRREARSQSEGIATANFTGKATHESALELIVITFRPPRASIAWTEQSDPVFDKNVRKGP